MVTVVKQSNAWEIVDFSSAGLAGELNKIKKQLTGDQFRRIKIFRLYQPLSTFLFYDDPAPGPDQIVLLPLLSAADYLESQGLPATKIWTLGEVVKLVRATGSVQNQEK